MLRPRNITVDGDWWGTVYTFEKAGDVFPTHVHGNVDNHITVLMHGRIRCTGHPKYEGREIEAVPGGIIINWTAGEPHGFVALTDGATIFNIRK